MVAPLLLLVGQVLLSNDFPCQSTTFNSKGATEFDQLLLVDVVERLPSETRVATFPLGEQRIHVDRTDVRIVWSIEKLDKVATLVVPANPNSFHELSVGKRYLILSNSSRNDKLRIPLPGLLMPSQFGIQTQGAGYSEFKRGSDLERLGLAGFEAKFQDIKTNENELHQLIDNVARCLVGTSSKNVHRVLNFLQLVDFRATPTDLQTILESDSFVISMRSAATQMIARDRARVHCQLAEWRVKGAQRDFYRSLMETAQENIVPVSPGFPLDYVEVFGTPPGPADRDNWANQVIDLALSTKTKTVRMFLIGNCRRAPSLERQRSLLKFVISEEQDSQMLILEQLALWNKQDGLVPHRKKVSGKWVIANLEELIARWKQMLGL